MLFIFILQPLVCFSVYFLNLILELQLCFLMTWPKPFFSKQTKGIFEYLLYQESAK